MVADGHVSSPLSQLKLIVDRTLRSREEWEIGPSPQHTRKGTCIASRKFGMPQGRCGDFEHGNRRSSVLVLFYVRESHPLNMRVTIITACRTLN